MAYIIDNKKIDMTQEEYDTYRQICRSYDRNNFKGEDLFKDLFETDDDGIIVFLKPPSKQYTSMEVYMFIIGIMHMQHIRILYKKVDEFILDAKNKLGMK